MESLRYVALGDSYTIGTGLAEAAQNFPSLLAKRIREETGTDVSLLNLGVNGYTTTDLLRAELPVARRVWPEVVTILIGANDIVQGSDEIAYRKRMVEIYAELVALGLAEKRAVAVSTPDFSGLPGAAPFGSPSALRTRIDAFNYIAQAEAAARALRYVDITDITGAPDRGDGWIAADGLHPGPAQHRAIADRIWATAGWGSGAWDRLSTAAVRVLVNARDEATILNAGYIGTEHLLLSLLRDTESVGAHVLKDRRVTYRMVLKTLQAVLGETKEGNKNPAGIIPTTRVGKVLRIAYQETRAAGADAVGTEHLLLALALEGEGIAAHVLADVGATPARVRAAIDVLDTHAGSVSQQPPGAEIGALPSNPDSMSQQHPRAWTRFITWLQRKL